MPHVATAGRDAAPSRHQHNLPRGGEAQESLKPVLDRINAEKAKKQKVQQEKDDAFITLQQSARELFMATTFHVEMATLAQLTLLTRYLFQATDTPILPGPSLY